ncbi:MAG: putative Ig domain-containing protein [Calditrichia bacterium]
MNDPVGASDSETATISIRHVNRPPVLAEPAAQTATEDESWSIQLPEASDPDTEDAGKLTYSMPNLPAGASFDAASRTVSWKPDFNQSGSHSLTYAVSDGSAEVTVNVAVTVENVNRPPSLNAPGEQQITEGESLQFRLEGNDPDSEDNGKLQYSAATMPPGANLDASSGEFSWTPGDDQQGTYRIDFVVKDAAGLQVSQTVTIVVADKPAPPAPPQSGNE